MDTDTTTEINTERQEQAHNYARIRRRLAYINIGIGVLCVLLFLGTRLNLWLRDIINHAARGNAVFSWQPVAGWFPLQILCYFAIIFIVYEIIRFPLSYYGDYTLSHRYGISVMSLTSWFRDAGISFILNIILEAAFVTLVYALLALQPQLWWLWAALIILFFSVVMANLAPVLLFPLFYKFTPLPDGELTERLLALVKRANTRVRGVFLMQMSNKTTATNAALMGLGNTRRIVLGDTMADRYTTDEIEVILAHELGHHVHRDIWKLIASQSMLMLVGLFLANLILHWAIDQQHYYLALTDPASLPFFFLVIGIFSFLILPINNGYTRRIEYQADEYALEATEKVEDFKNAMKRLANQNLAEVEPAPIIEFLFHSHPSIAKRLRHADEFARRRGYRASASLSADN